MRKSKSDAPARLAVTCAVFILSVAGTAGAEAEDRAGKAPPSVPLRSLVAERIVAAAMQDSEAATEDIQIQAEDVAEEATGYGLYSGTLTSRRSGKPIPQAHLTFRQVEGEKEFRVDTDDEGRYEIRMPTGRYLVEIRIGKKTYGGSGTFREEVPGKRWALDFVISRKLTDQNFELEALPGQTEVHPVYVPPPPYDPHWWEFLVFIGTVAGIAALAE